MSFLGTAPAVLNEFDPRWQMEKFANVISDVSAGAGCVVALARAAPRLLALAGFTSEPERPIVCEYTIDFLPATWFKGRKVLLFDDTINYGSTMHDVRSRLETAGADVECFAAVVDQNTFLGELSANNTTQVAGPSPFVEGLRADWFQKLGTQDVQLFHNAEVRAFRTLGKPYTLDFPIFNLPLLPATREFGPAALAKLLGDDPSTPFFHPYSYETAERELYSITLPLRPSVLTQLLVAPASVITFQPHSKVRLYFDYDCLMLRFAPMVQVHTGRDIELASFCDAAGQHLWETLRAHVLESDFCDDSKRRMIALHRAFVFAFSVAAGRLLWASVLRPALQGLTSDSDPTLCEADTSLLFGPSLGRQVVQVAGVKMPVADSVVGSLIGFDAEDTGQVEENSTRRQASDPTLCQQLLAYRLRDGAVPTWRPDPASCAVENVGSLLPYLRRVIDTDQRGTTQSASRLQRGLSFDDLYILLNANGATCTIPDLSFAVDILVDGGMLVPQLVFHSSTGLVTRSFRSGENDASDPTLQLKSIVHKLLTDRQSSGDPTLSEKAFSKVFAILKLLHHRHLPIALRLRTYGVEPFMDDAVLREWCRDHRIVRITDDQKGASHG